MSFDPEQTDLPDSYDIAEAAIAKRLGTMRTVIPAKIVSYSVSETSGPEISARIAVRDLVADAETGDLSQVVPPVLHNIPVLFPGSSAGILTFGLSPGDTVLLLFADRSIAEWKTTGNSDNSPIDLLSRFSVADAVALPLGPARGAVFSPAQYASGAVVLAGSDVRLGDSTATSPVALHTALNAYLGLLKTWLDTHVHPDPITGFTGLPSVSSPSTPSFAATKVKGI